MDKAQFQAMWANAPRPVAQGAVPQVVVNLPHRGTSELLDAVLPLWLGQSVPLVVDVVDTGSGWPTCSYIDSLCRNHDGKVRLHTLGTRPWKHPSEPIAIACELSQVYAETEYVLFSHVDVFPHSQNLVRWLMDQCSASSPVVGYEISPRDHVVGFLSKEWQGMVGHSLTMIHLPTIRAAGVSWLYDERSLVDVFGWKREELAGWDTEVTFNLWLRLCRLTPKLVGHDQNMEHLVDAWHGHARSYPGSLLFGHPHLVDAARWVRQEMAEAMERLRTWAV